ncbi:SusC/RagA family TonB-linked outer membrane protein [Chitinophaga costaii]|nr:SusC/RagA family TonB-linked outer membrane protein [Chitinophaga costaii]
MLQQSAPSRRLIKLLFAAALLTGGLPPELKAAIDHHYTTRLTVTETQVKSIDLVCQRRELSWVIASLQQQSGFAFVFSDDDIDTRQKISLNIQHQEFKESLQIIFTPLGIHFEMLNDKVLLRKDGATTLLPNPAHALVDGEVHGRVTDEKGQPIPGVTVQIKNTSKGTVTDAQGYYTLKFTGEQVVLQISYLGYDKQELATNGGTLNVQLKTSNTTLNDVVVVGYGTQRRVTVTGAIDQVKSQQLEGRPVANTMQALQGASPNLIIQQPNAQPGAAVNINIRGLSTLGDNTPLVVIDGIPGGDINLLNPSDIDNVSVLKDAGAAAIYGSRAANGVILVTTKRGSKTAKPLVTYNGILSVTQPHILFHPVKGYENMMLRNEAVVNANPNQQPIYSPDDIAQMKEKGDEEWILDAILQNALQQNHNLSVTGGNDKTTYMVSAGYLNQANNFVGPDYGLKRYNYRMNLTTEIGRFKFTSLLSYTHSDLKDQSYDAGFLMADAERTPTYYALKDSLGRYLTNDVLTEFNPLGILQHGGSSKNDNDNLFGSFTGELAVTKDLKLRGVLGGTLNANHRFIRVQEVDFYPKGTYGQNRNTDDYNEKNIFINTQLLAEYTKKLGNHNIYVLGGFTNESFTKRSNELKLKYTDPDLGTPTTGTVIDPGSTNTNQGTTETSLNSFIGRASYSYQDRYFAEVDFRADASSKFAKDHRWGYFPSISGGWRISSEKFFSRFANTINELKLRGSYGVLGNQNIQPYQYQTTYTVYNNMYGFNNSPVSGTGFTFSNPDVTWEKAATLDGGVDIGVFNNKLTASFDYFTKLTSNILLVPPTPGAYGGAVPFYNLGKVRNQGWEFSIHYRTGNQVHQEFGFNIADSHNEVIYLDGQQYISSGDEMQVILKEGLPYNSYIGLKRDGYFQNLNDIQNAAKPAGLDVSPGDIKFKDKNKDGVIDDNDRYVLGNPFPRYTFGFNYNISWKGFDLGMLIQGVGKRAMFIRGELVEPFHYNYSQVIYQHQLDYWRPDNPDARYPRLAANGSASNTNNFRRGSDLYIFNGAYGRLKNLQLGYSLPGNVAQHIGMKKLRVYLTGQNLLTISGVKFIDPESTEFKNGQGNGSQQNNLSVSAGGNSGRAYPTPIYYGFGLDATF